MIGIGEIAPDFSDEDVRTGVTFTLPEYEDRVVVLTFSGLTWCSPCKREAPVLQEVWQEFEPHGVQFVMVSWDDPHDELLDALSQYGITFPVVDDPTIPDEYGLDSVPITYILIRDRQVLHVLRGFGFDLEASKNELRQAILSAMGFPSEDQVIGCLYEIARRLGIIFLIKMLRRPKVIGEVRFRKAGPSKTN